MRAIRQVKGLKPVPISVLGNKTDLRRLREVGGRVVKEYARFNFVQYAEGSATSLTRQGGGMLLCDHLVKVLHISFMDLEDDADESEPDEGYARCVSHLSSEGCGLM